MFLKRGQIAKVEISPAVNVPWRPYKLSTDLNISVLTGRNTGSSGISANSTRNKKQVCLICLSLAYTVDVYVFLISTFAFYFDIFFKRNIFWSAKE